MGSVVLPGRNGLELGGIAAGAGSLGVRIVDRETRLLQAVDPVDLGAGEIGRTHPVDPDFERPELGNHVVVHLAVIEIEGIAEAGTPAGLDRNSKGVFLVLVLDASRNLLLQQIEHLRRSRFGDEYVSRCNRHLDSSLSTPPAARWPTYLLSVPTEPRFIPNISQHQWTTNHSARKTPTASKINPTKRGRTRVGG